MYLGPGSKKTPSTQENRGLDRRDDRRFRDRDEENVIDQAFLICFATAALVVLVFYLMRRRRRIVFD